VVVAIREPLTGAPMSQSCQVQALRASRRCTMRAHRPTGGRGWSATGPRTLVTPWTAPDLAGLADKRLDHDAARRQKQSADPWDAALDHGSGLGPLSRPPPSATRRTLLAHTTTACNKGSARSTGTGGTV